MALSAHEARGRAEQEQGEVALQPQRAAVAELEQEWAGVARQLGSERARLASLRSAALQREADLKREVSELQLAAGDLRHDSATLEQRVARLQSSLDKVQADTREVARRLQQRAAAMATEAVTAAPLTASSVGGGGGGGGGGEAMRTAQLATPTPSPRASPSYSREEQRAAGEGSDGSDSSDSSRLAVASAASAASTARAGQSRVYGVASPEPREYGVASPATGRRRLDHVSEMSDNEKYYYYLERNKGRLDLDQPDPDRGVRGGSTRYTPPGP